MDDNEYYMVGCKHFDYDDTGCSIGTDVSFINVFDNMNDVNQCLNELDNNDDTICAWYDIINYDTFTTMGGVITP